MSLQLEGGTEGKAQDAEGRKEGRKEKRRTRGIEVLGLICASLGKPTSEIHCSISSMSYLDGLEDER